jgi:hypothetical protein
VPELRVKIGWRSSVVGRNVGPVHRGEKDVAVDCRAYLVFQLQLPGVFILKLRSVTRNASCHSTGAFQYILSRRLLHNENLTGIGRSRVDLGKRKGRSRCSASELAAVEGYRKRSVVIRRPRARDVAVEVVRVCSTGQDEDLRQSLRAAVPLWITGLPHREKGHSTPSIACPDCSRSFSLSLCCGDLDRHEQICPYCFSTVQLAIVRHLGACTPL